MQLTNIPGREAVELFPTLEVAPVTPRTDAFLAHAPIPVQFTEEDFDQVMSGNFVTKVIYLPDPEFQELALAGVETLVSTRLDPGVDPIAEADRRGSILAIVRMGNKDFRASAGSYNYGPYGPSGPGGVMCANYQDEGPSTEMAPQPYESYDGGGSTAPTDGQPSLSAWTAATRAAATTAVAATANGGTVAATMPMGMPTAGFAPAAMPPNMIAGGPTWGMPITGTPIGLPGPPHIPLGGPAGLQHHVMKNRTRIHMPPPVTQMTMSVKQRPGMNYPRPVNHVTVDEMHREPGGLFPGICGTVQSSTRCGHGRRTAARLRSVLPMSTECGRRARRDPCENESE